MGASGVVPEHPLRSNLKHPVTAFSEVSSPEMRPTQYSRFAETNLQHRILVIAGRLTAMQGKIRAAPTFPGAELRTGRDRTNWID